MRQSARQVELNSRREASLAAEEAAAEVDRQHQAEIVRGLQEQLLGIIPVEEVDFDLPVEMQTTESGKGSCRSKKGLPNGVPYYRTLKRNLYKPPLFQPQLREGDDIPVCSCTSSTGCGALCQNRNLYMECVPGYCPSCVGNKAEEVDELEIESGGNEINHACAKSSVSTGPEDDDDETEDEGDDDDEGNLAMQANIEDGGVYCMNTAIQRKRFPKSEVYDPGNGCGFGLRVMEDVNAGTILIEYLGEVITQEETNERMAECDEHDDFYFASLGGGLYLDAKPMGSVARFANHSCDPSCELQKWIVRGEPRICLVSVRPMNEGEEITYNYQYYEDGFDTSGGNGADMAAFRRQRCLCGSENCCGTIGGRVEESISAAWRKRASRILAAPSGNAGLKMTISDLLDLTSSYTLLEASISPNSAEVTMLKELIAQGLAWLQRGAAIVPPDLYTFDELKRFPNNDAAATGGGGGGGGGVSADGMYGSNVGSHDVLAAESIPASFVSLPDLQDLIKTVPTAMRFLALPALKQAAKKAIDAERSARELVGILQSRNNVIVSTSSSSSSDKCGKDAIAVSDSILMLQKPDSRIYWEDLASSLRELSSVLPVLVSPTTVWRVLELYQECSNWCRRWLSGLRPVMDAFNADKGAGASGGSNLELVIERGDRLLWGSLVDVSTAYDYAVTCDYFAVHTFLKNRIIAAMARPSFREAVSKAIVSGRDRDRVNRKTEGKKAENLGAGTVQVRTEADASEELHCFCQLPEHEGELGTLAMCELCHRWYHPPCLNTTPARLSSYNFYCPLCCIGNNLHLSLNRFAVAPAAEYTIKPGQDRREVRLRKNNGGTQGSGKGKLKSKASGRSSNITNPSNKPPRAHQPHGQYQRFLSSAAHSRPASAKLCNEGPALLKSGQGDYLSMTDLNACLDEESRLQVCASGVQGLLDVIRTFIASWGADVSAFLTDSTLQNALSGNPWPTIKVGYDQDNGNKPDSKTYRKIMNEVLDQCLQLYYAPRVVRIRPYESLATLRKLAWAISVHPLLNSLPSITPSSNSSSASVDLVTQLGLSLERDLIEHYADPLDYDKHRSSSFSSSTSTSCSTSTSLSGRALINLMRREIRTISTNDTPPLALEDLNSVVHGAAALGLPLEPVQKKQGHSPSEDVVSKIELISVTLATLRTACRQILARADAFLYRTINIAATSNHPTPTLGVAQAVKELCTHAMHLSQCVQQQQVGQDEEGSTPDAAVELVRKLAGNVDQSNGTSLLPQSAVQGQREVSRLIFDDSQMAELCAICLRLRAIGQFIDLSGNYVYCALLTFLVNVMRSHRDSKVHTGTNGHVDLGSGTDCDSSTTAGDEDVGVIDKEDDEDEYCWCLRGEGPHVGQMISCDVCEEWYHVNCVTRGLTQKAVNKLSSFVCCACETARGRKYKHSW